MRKSVVYTIGHSTHPIDEFLELLTAHGVQKVVNVRTFVARCHRSLIADALAVSGWRVLHIQSQKTARAHRCTPFLKVRRGRLLYPAPAQPDAVYSRDV